MSKLAETIFAMINTSIEALQTISLKEITNIGSDKFTIRHSSGGTLQWRNDGKIYYNGSELESGTVPLWESDGSGTTSLTTPENVDLGDYWCRVTNDGYFLVGNATDGMWMGHDGSDHEIYTNNGSIKIQPSGGLYITTGGSATLNGNSILTSSWSDDVSAGGNSLSSLYTLNFHSLGGLIQNDGTSMMDFDSGGDILLLANMDFGGTAGMDDVDHIVMKTAYTPTADLQVATKKYVDDNGGGDVTNPMTADLAAGGYDISNVDVLSFNSGGTSYMNDDGSGNLGFTAANTASVNGGTGGVSITGGTAAITLTPYTGYNVEIGGDMDMNTNKFYLYNTGTDSSSMYIYRNSTSGNMIIHVPTGESVEWHVGDGA